MRCRRLSTGLLATFLAAFVLTLAACGSSSSSGPPLPVAVSFTTAPPSSVTVGGTFQVVAVVSNASNTNINWSCAPTGSCGSFNPAQTASGAATIYTAPLTVPTGASVTIQGVSAADSTKSASANVTIALATPTVAFAVPAPPVTLTVGSAATLTASVTNDPANAGVDWTVSCSGGGCGGFTLPHTASGSPTMYNPPANAANGLAVTIKAAATSNPADSVSAVIVVGTTPTSAFLCAGCAYTYSVAGTDGAGNFGLAGVFTTDGMGNVTGGEQDFSDFSFSTGKTPDSIVSGTYTFGADGRGIITLALSNTGIGVNGVETFGVVMITPNHMLLNELDQSATASGSMDMQTLRSFSPSTLNGNYTYVAGGADLLNDLPLGFGGVFNVSSPGTVSSTSGVCDANLGGFTSAQQGYTSGSGYTGPDALGRTLITLRPNFIGNLNQQFNLGVNGPVILATYINDAIHLKFVEVDPNFGITSGLAVGQGAASGNILGGGALPANASFVFTDFGTGFGSGVVGPSALAATMTSDGTSKLQNGFSDVNAAGVPTSGSVSGTYAVDPGGTGRVAVTLTGTVGNPGNSGAYAIYLTGGSDPAMILELDANAITTGSFYAQASGSFTLASFQGPYGLNFSLFDPSGSAEVDVNGQTFADGGGNLLGTLDINNFGQPIPNVPFTGSYAAGVSGRFTGSIKSTTTGTLGVSYFVVSPSLVIFIETDAANAVSLGLFQTQQPPF